MSFIFGRKKSPTELVRSTQKHIGLLQSLPADDEKSLKKSLEKISLNLSNMKFMLYGDAENEPKDADIAKLCDELFATNALIDLLVHMKEFEFEARKDVARVYDFVLRQRKQQSVEYVKAHPDILKVLVEGYNDSEIALNCGQILREVIRHEELNELILTSPTLFDLFFDYVQLSTFDIASDAFATFKLMLTKHKVQCAKFLDAHFDSFVTKYNVLLQSRNYVTKRQSLKLLGELLLNRSNFTIMMRYINNADNLKIMMNMLRGNCFPLDHQVLTSAGFVTLSGAKELAAAGKLEAACWIDGRLEYHAATVVEKPDKERVFVSIGGQEDRAHIDLCTTDNHRVFGRVGKGIACNNQWSRRGKESIVPPLAVHEAGGLLEHADGEPLTVLQLMAFAEHGLAASGESLPFIAALGLTTGDQIDAFLLLYGYWLGDGWLNDGKICFGPRKKHDMRWLECLFTRLPLRKRSSAVIGQSGFWRADNLSASRQRYYLITEPAWVEFFWAEYGHKYAAPVYATQYVTVRTVLSNISNSSSSSSSRSCSTTASSNNSWSPLSKSTSSSGKSASPSATKRLQMNALDWPYAASSSPVSSSRAISAENSDTNSPLNLSRDSNSAHNTPQSGYRDGLPAAAAAVHGVENVRMEDGEAAVAGNSAFKAFSSHKDAVFSKTLVVSSTSVVAAEPEPLEAEDVNSAKWFWHWVYRRLGVRRLRLVLSGLRTADGDKAANLNRIYTSSVRFRDEIERVALHAGYSVQFTLKSRIGDVNGNNEQGKDIEARHNAYCVAYTVDPKFAVPKEKVESWVTSAVESGVVWCVTVPEHTGQLIVVRRIQEMEGDEVILASRPVVVGNTKAIQFEAFHVFKIFVANPKKSQAVVDILIRNKRKLIEFLMKFQKEKEDDQFNEEKNTLLATLSALPDPQPEMDSGEEEKKEEC